MSKRAPEAFHRAHAKRGPADCAIAAMATIFRRDPEEVLIAAARVNPSVWTSGLTTAQMLKTARRLGIKTTLKYRDQIDPEDTGVLWVSYHDRTDEHCVALIEGIVIDPEYDPPVIARYDEYTAAMYAYGNALLMVKE